MKPPFAISQYTTLPLTFTEDLKLYGALGIEQVEICESKLSGANPDRELRAVQAGGFQVTSVQPRIHSPFPNSLRSTPAAPRERMQRLRKSITLFSRYFPGTVLVLNTGLAPGGNIAAARRVAVREFKAIARVAADHGVGVALEPLNPVYMNTDTFVCSLARAGEMIDEVGHPAFGLFLDLWHFWEDAAAPAEIRRQAKRIFGVHISDWRTPRAFGDRVLPGAGEIPIVALLKTIRQSGYRGAYTLEIFSDPRLKDSLWKNPRRTAADGQKVFGKIWRRVCA
ncbi:MAG: 4-hydroxyphenylpyruvate dioxygenase [Verrucomicrobia bacterium]|nr:4-hydroxyphenylpyruvate dioxygenase [Verrucomicrobiota bacterium]